MKGSSIAEAIAELTAAIKASEPALGAKASFGAAIDQVAAKPFKASKGRMVIKQGDRLAQVEANGTIKKQVALDAWRKNYFGRTD